MTEAVSHTEQLEQKLVVWCYNCEEYVYFENLVKCETGFLCPECSTSFDREEAVLLVRDVSPLAEKLDKTVTDLKSMLTWAKIERKKVVDILDSELMKMVPKQHRERWEGQKQVFDDLIEALEKAVQQ